MDKPIPAYVNQHFLGLLLTIHNNRLHAVNMDQQMHDSH